MVDGASILIVVGVVLDTMSQIESYLTVRHYEGIPERSETQRQTALSVFA